MKGYYIAAATLLLGTSAFAWAPSTDKPLDSSWEQTAPTAGDPDLDLAENPDTTTAPAAEPEAASPEPADSEAADTGMADASDTGIGGPVEATEPAPAPVAIAAADLAPRPAAQNYPPCAPGPGDDNCIQLYEPGVQVALASWNQPTGGLMQPGEAMASADTAAEPAATGVGGPYEPVGEAEEAEIAMNGDGMVDPAFGETVDIDV